MNVPPFYVSSASLEVPPMRFLERRITTQHFIVKEKFSDWLDQCKEIL
jgi:hypothetical protein